MLNKLFRLFTVPLMKISFLETGLSKRERNRQELLGSCNGRLPSRKFSARLLLLPPPCQPCSPLLIPGCSRRTRYRRGKGFGEKKRGESRQRLYLRRILILVSSQTVCPDTSLVSSHRRCLVVSLPSEHAVNDLKMAVSPWKRFRREKGG